MTEAWQPVREILKKSRDYAESKIWAADAYVTQYRKSDRKAKVKLTVNSQETDWLRTMALGSGESFAHVGFEENQDVVVMFFGSLSDGVVLGGFADGAAQNDLDIVFSRKTGEVITMEQGKITIDAPTVQINATTANIDAGTVNLAGGNLLQGVARVGDMVATAFGPAPITSGSSKVFAGG
jgi:hypothetical protein